MEIDTKDFSKSVSGGYTRCDKYKEKAGGRVILVDKDSPPCELDPECDGSLRSWFFIGWCRFLKK